MTAIVYDEITDAGQLPAGWTDIQDAGSYRPERRDDDARFGYAVGPHSWKQYLLPPRLRLARIHRNPGADPGEGPAGSGADGPSPTDADRHAFTVEEEPAPTTRLA